MTMKKSPLLDSDQGEYVGAVKWLALRSKGRYRAIWAGWLAGCREMLIEDTILLI